MHALIFGFCWIRSCRIGHSCCGTSIEQHRCAAGQKKKTGLTRISLCDTPASTKEKLKWSLRMVPSNTTNFSFAEKLLEMSETKKKCWKCLRERRLSCRMSLHHHDHEQPQTWVSKRVLEILVLCVLRQNRVHFMHELRGGLALPNSKELSVSMTNRTWPNYASNAATEWPYRFRSRGTTGSMLDHDLGDFVSW